MAGKKLNKREKKIIALAYCNRYGCFLAVLAAMFLPDMWIGVVVFGYGLYQFVGYKLNLLFISGRLSPENDTESHEVEHD